MRAVGTAIADDKKEMHIRIQKRDLTSADAAGEETIEAYEEELKRLKQRVNAILPPPAPKPKVTAKPISSTGLQKPPKPLTAQ